MKPARVQPYRRRGGIIVAIRAAVHFGRAYPATKPDAAPGVRACPAIGGAQCYDVSCTAECLIELKRALGVK